MRTEKDTTMKSAIFRPMTARGARPGLALGLGVAILAMAGGCAGEAGLPKDGTVVVSPDSEQARKAMAERDQMIRERERQEAKARKRLRGLTVRE
jgi:hypothetical protein